MTHKPFKYSIDIRKIYSFIFISVLWFMLNKKSENVRLRYCDVKDKYLHPTGVKDVEHMSCTHQYIMLSYFIDRKSNWRPTK
jgi:hypothetical protein